MTKQLSGQALTERQGAARIGVLEVVNSYPLDPGLLPHPPGGPPRCLLEGWVGATSEMRPQALEFD